MRIEKLGLAALAAVFALALPGCETVSGKRPEVRAVAGLVNGESTRMTHDE